ncbi:MAG: uncharacterized protein H6Q25_1025 [Bacteroidetes bacterium]|nr:uncharacterized protein [Bacteroidota bacterium]
MKIAFLAYPKCSLWSLIGSYEIFQKTERMVQLYPSRFKLKQNFTLMTVSTTSERKIIGSYGNGFETDCTIFEMERPDLLIIPGFDRDFNMILSDQAMINTIKDLYQNGTDIATVCTGAFILAETGILDHQTATTHWLYKKEFTYRFKTIQLEIDKLLIDHQRICMSGGASSFQNMMIYLIEKYLSKELAIFMSKMLLIENDRYNQNNFVIFNGQKNHGDTSILKAQNLIEEKMDQFIPIEELAQNSYMSKRNFLRRFKMATGDTPFVYMQKTKIEAAKNLLEEIHYPILEIAFRTGYTDYPSFRKSFKTLTGLTPSEYRKKYCIIQH